MPNSSIISATEIAELLGLKLSTFQKKRRAMFDAGMPRPVPGLNLIWSRANIMAWINGVTPAEPTDEEPIDQVDAARAALEQRIGGEL
jgi:predicted DNA-binding transcriptional regulator AlpA